MAEAEHPKDRARLDDLIKAMPRIAEAVKAFPESVQGKAFDALMAELTGASTESNAVDETPTDTRRSRRRAAPTPQKKEGKKRRAGGPSALRGLDLSPTGKKSWKAFAQEKQPSSQHDRNVIAVYYLKEILSIDKVTVDHVFTCYVDMSWREPTNLANSLALTANRKRYLDTSSLDDIKLSPPGRNRVSHELPKKKKAT